LKEVYISILEQAREREGKVRLKKVILPWHILRGFTSFAKAVHWVKDRDSPKLVCYLSKMVVPSTVSLQSMTHRVFQT
jgi:hypothetical protein